MAWRAMNSLLVLRDQANTLAPNRSKASDGLVGDEAHQSTNSDHNPHYVPGVGNEIVTALDLTHDPAHGFDSYRFAEILRKRRDPRIKYVISNHRIFSSYATGSRAAWEWGPYSGVDPHTGHVHVSVLDAKISDTTTPWNLEGFMATQFNDDDIAVLRGAALAVLQYSGRGIGENNGGSVAKSFLAYTDEILRNTRYIKGAIPADLVAQLNAILAAASDDGDTTVILPPDALAALEEIKNLINEVPTAEENADAVIAEIAS